MQDEPREGAGGDQTPSGKDAADAWELVRDWEFLFWVFLIFGLERLVWMYVARPENGGFHIGLSCGFVLCGALGSAMRWVLNPPKKQEGVDDAEHYSLEAVV